MKKLFISQPMRGKTDEEILAVRAQAKHEVEASLMEKVVVIDSFIQGAPADAKPLWYLGNPWSCSPRQTSHTLPRAGKKHADAESSTNVPRSMAASG